MNDDDRPVLRVRRVTEAEVEDWLGVEPAGRLDVREALSTARELPVADDRPQPVLDVGVGLICTAAVLLLAMLIRQAPPEAYIMAGTVGLVGLGVAFAACVQPEPPRYDCAITAGADGLTVQHGERIRELPWADLAECGYMTGPFVERTWPEAEGSIWRLTFGHLRTLAAPRPPVLYLRVRDVATCHLARALRAAMDARRHGALLPGDPDPPDLTVPTGALSPAGTTSPERDRGLSRAEQELDA